MLGTSTYSLISATNISFWPCLGQVTNQRPDAITLSKPILLYTRITCASWRLHIFPLANVKCFSYCPGDQLWDFQNWTFRLQRFSGGPKHPHMAFATSQVANKPRNDLLEVLNMASTLNTPGYLCFSKPRRRQCLQLPVEGQMGICYGLWPRIMQLVTLSYVQEDLTTIPDHVKHLSSGRK